MIGSREKIFQGIKAGSPLALGYFPIAVAFGALAVQADLTWVEATLMSILVFAGASQFVGVSMLLAGAGMVQIIMATFFLNLRHLMMSMTLNHQFRSFSAREKIALSFGITDESFAVLALGGQGGDEHQALTPHYTAGLMITAYLGWVSGSAFGAIFAGVIPGEITTAMTAGLYALFIGLLVPPIKKSPVYLTAAGAGMLFNYLAGFFLESGWSIVLATLCASVLGLLILEGSE
ncbi:MAG: AzlC family ABC transporter permease [Anaerolineales bacterium]|nr:AzlC family ABC transporter permease [Anaerolineales bacterium]